MSQPDELAELVASPTYASARAKLAVLQQGNGGEMLTHDEGVAIELVQELTGETDPAAWPDPA